MVVAINQENKKFVRSEDGVVAGVFQGLGESFQINPNILRALWLVSFFFYGVGLAFYLIFAIVLPRRDQLTSYNSKKAFGVCLAISRKTGMELGLVRLLTLLSAIVSFGLTIVLYFLLFFILPEDSEQLYF